jgi:hypothetical protein
MPFSVRSHTALQTFVFRCALLTLILLLTVVATVSAQSPATTPPKPDYKTLRFDEQWTAAQRTSHWDDAIKAIPLTSGYPVTLTIAGQARWREEFARQFNLTDANDDYAQSRLQLSADLQAGRSAKTHARLFAEVRDAQSYGRTLPGGTRPSDADRHDVQNLFVDLGYGKSWIRYGRQEIVLNRERLMGVPDWASTRRGSEGVRAQLVGGALMLEATDTRPVTMRQTLGNRADSTTRFRTVSIGNAAGAKSWRTGLPAIWQGYWYEQVIELPSVRTRRTTTGARTMWQTASTQSPRRYTLEFEGALQRGTSGATDLDAWFWVVESAVQWRRVRGAPTLTIGVEEASGNRANTASRNEAFNVLYPAAHAHGGTADVIGRQNVRELHMFGAWSPLKPLDLRGGLYRFDRLRTDDGVYNKGNGILRAANGSNARHVANEIDYAATWKASRHWRVIGGGAMVLPGDFLKSATPTSSTMHWGYVGTAFTF